MKSLLWFISISLMFASVPYNSLRINQMDDQENYKCLIQLSNYGGMGAYVIVSLVHPEDGYEKTLSVSGDEIDWYEDLPEWYTFVENTNENIDGVTGASIQSGGRKVVVLTVDKEKINAGYKLRFETAVEDKEYFVNDVEVDLVDSNIGPSLKGTGYIRFIKLINQ